MKKFAVENWFNGSKVVYLSADLNVDTFKG